MEYAEQIYAGTLGKAIGVYYGRPVEGWTYPAIRDRFGEIDYYVAEATGAPLIVPDDDISGTFVFFRALADNDHRFPLPAGLIGDTWLNYIVENTTVLWWGGLSRSTEHTAYLRLKAGVPAPRSGSMALNGRSMAEQIGAQIFIDGWAMAAPGDPERAAALARAAASVSHDGLAVEAACFLAAMEALAFVEPRPETLIESCRHLVTDPRLAAVVDGVVEACRSAGDWREVRDWIAEHHGYDRYPGNCPMATNHAVVLMALLMAGDDFHRSLGIAASAGWDTDCNTGNVGCLNGIRLGLAGIERGADLRGPVADRLYVVSADGGECLSDTVREARRIIASAAALRGEPAPAPRPRFGFDFPGSVQGFQPYPGLTGGQALTVLSNDDPERPGLRLHYRALARGVRAAVSVDTFVPPRPVGQAGTSYFEVVASPSLYPTQSVRAVVEAPDPAPVLRFFVDFYDQREQIATVTGEPFGLTPGVNELTWRVPDTGGLPLYRLGIMLESGERLDGSVRIVSVDWAGAPERFALGRSMELSPWLTPWTTDTVWLRSFVSSAAHLAPDYTTTMSISHPEPGGVITTGGRDWDDYRVGSVITFSQQRRAGLVARAQGHRRFYAAVLADGAAELIRRRDGEVTCLARVPSDHRTDETHRLDLEVRGNALTFHLDGVVVARAADGAYRCGGAGFLVDEGAILADGFQIIGEEPG